MAVNNLSDAEAGADHRRIVVSIHAVSGADENDRDVVGVPWYWAGFHRVVVDNDSYGLTQFENYL